MRVSVLYFAAARDLAGTSEEPLELAEGVTVGGALEAIVRRHPALAPHVRQLRVARNEAFAELGDRVAPGDVLALIPPVAGGA